MAKPNNVRLAEKLDADEQAFVNGTDIRQWGRRIREVAHDERDDERVTETMTTSDFALFGDTIDRSIVEANTPDAIGQNFDVLGYRDDTSDFEESSGHQLQLPMRANRVPEKGEYEPMQYSDTEYTYHTDKYGFQWDLSMEAWLRDQADLGLLARASDAWAGSEVYTKQYEFTNAYAGNVVGGTFFSAAHNNYAAGAGTDLDADSLEDALIDVQTQTNAEGETLGYAGDIYLVVPPQLQYTAKQLVRSQRLKGDTDEGENNPLAGAAEVVVDPLIPSVNATYGATMWFLFCDPRLRPAYRQGVVTGFEGVEVLIRQAQARALAGGGTGDPFDGSFLDDDLMFKIRFTFGVDELDYRGAVCYLGQAE